MVLEDTVAQSQRIISSSSLSDKEIYTLKQEIDNLNAVLIAKEDSYTVLGSKLKALEAARQNEKNEVKSKMIEMNQTIVGLRNLNHELEGEASDARHRLGLIEGDLSRYTAEVQQLQHELQRSEAQRAQKENESSKDIKALIGARDDAIQKMQHATTQYEIMQVQLREAQARHWDELQRAKETEVTTIIITITITVNLNIIRLN
jgi:chromosome segregation ATPase